MSAVKHRWLQHRLFIHLKQFVRTYAVVAARVDIHAVASLYSATTAFLFATVFLQREVMNGLSCNLQSVFLWRTER
jgi:hypothetical protein